MQNQRPYLIHSDLVLNLMRCIGPAATAEDDEEQLNLHSPAMLKKTRPLSSNSGTPAGDLPSDTAGNGRAATEKKQAIVSDELEWPVDAEMFSAAEISEMATLLLRMILELCGGHFPLQSRVSALETLQLSISYATCSLMTKQCAMAAEVLLLLI